MSNDPKNTVVDLSKLMQGQSQTPVPTPMPTISDSSIAAMLTSCTEGAELGLVGNEHFTYNGGNNQVKDD